MKIFLTGASGYIGPRLLLMLLEQGHHVICCVRDPGRFEKPSTNKGSYEVVKADFLAPDSLLRLPKDFDASYYLMHSMSATVQDFDDLEKRVAQNFVDYIDSTSCKQVIYLSGIINDDELSKHLISRKVVEETLQTAAVPLTTLRAGIIVGSGSASFEIIRDIVEKLPIMITPRWLDSKCAPIAVRDVLNYLIGVLNVESYFGKNYDIGGPETLTYKEMLLQFGQVRKLRRWIFTLPIMTPRLSSYWLFFVTSTSYNLAVNLVNSLKNDVIPRPNSIAEEIGLQLIPYKEAVNLAFQKIKQNEILSSWKDSLISSSEEGDLNHHLQIPKYGCFKDFKTTPLTQSSEKVLENIFAVGGERGWYAFNWLWKIRGFMDKLFGGVGLRRGRRHPYEIFPGDALDFWRVLVADQEQERMLLYAEMLLPGEAWLEFQIITETNGKSYLYQTATFRPLGILGRLYWYSVVPFHFFVFTGMNKNMEAYK